MAKTKENKPKEEKPFVIMSAAIKDGFCNYAFEIKTGVNIGDINNVKGSGIIDSDLEYAFGKLNVHLAALDDIFKHSDTEVVNIDKMHTNPLTMEYEVTGFKIKGGDENESIILVGHKRISCSGERMALETPKIPLDKLSSYEYWKDLKKASELCREEVELYKGGKCTPVEPEEKEDKKQLKIGEDVEDLDLEKGRK